MSKVVKEVKQGAKDAIVIPSEFTERILRLLKSMGVKDTCLDEKEGIFYAPSHLVGQICLGDFTIKINPKHEEMTYSRILSLYNYVYNSSDIIFDGEISSITSIDEFKTFLITEFQSELNKYSQHGLITDFICTQKNRSSLKGNIDWPKSILNIKSIRDKPIVSNVTSTSVNNDGNKLIKLALDIVSSNLKYKSELSRANVAFKAIVGCNLNYKSIVRKSPKFLKVKKLLALSEMIVKNFKSGDMNGDLDEAFLVNYDKLFEDYVAKLLLTYGDGHFTSYFGKMVFGHVFDEKKKLSDKEYKPDYIYRFDASKQICQAVLDAKNKVKKYNNSDIYEIMLYASFLDAKAAVFIYPSFDAVGEKQILKITNSFAKMKTIYAVAVDMNNADFENVGVKLTDDLNKVMFL